MNNHDVSAFCMPDLDERASEEGRIGQIKDDFFEKVVSITEAARLNSVTRQAIYVAIKQRKLKARKHMARWVIHLDDLEEYKRQKYSRSKSTFNGELLFDNNRGYYSINQTAKILGVPAQKVYYATRVGHLQAHRKGSAWVVHIDDVTKYKESYLAPKRAVVAS